MDRADEFVFGCGVGNAQHDKGEAKQEFNKNA